MSRKNSSIDLSKTQKEDEEELGMEGEEGEEGEEGKEERGENELKGLLQRRVANTWSEAGAKKEFVIGKLIKYFGSLVVRLERSDSDSINPVYIYEKAPNASLNVVRARLILKDNENFETKDFTIFISKRKWVTNELRPLLELCSEDLIGGSSDQDLAMRCCRLVLVLIKRMRDTTEKALAVEAKLRIGKETKEEGIERYNRQSQSKSNAMEQLSALLSFKEALCTAKCAKAITLVFADCLRKESEETHETVKGDLATCISYLRRMLAIDSNSKASSPGEIIAARSVHRRFIVYHRAMLGAMPALCIDIKDQYHNDWFTEIIMIISSLLRGYEASELLQIWKSGKLLSADDMSSVNELVLKSDSTSTTQQSGNESGGSNGSRNGSSGAVSTSSSRAPKSAGTGRSTAGPLTTAIPMATSGGLLSRQLNLERSNKLKAAQAYNRFGGGAYRQAVATASTGPEETAAQSTVNGSQFELSGTQPGQGLRVMVLRSPLLSEEIGRQAKRKRVKKNLTFADQDPYEGLLDACPSDQTLTAASCAVVATIVDAIVESAGLVQLVSRVNEDLRRGDDRVSLDLELIYFKGLATLLHYNRLKVLDQRQAHISRGSSGGPWVPQLQNVLKALDKMSFTRVLFTMERLHGKDKRYSDVHIPMRVYKEMISYIRLLLESGDSDHNEIAVAALYRIFYSASSERQDPLLRLLSEWKPAMFPRDHVNCLVDLVAETMETLNAARSRFRNSQFSDALKAKEKGKVKKGELAIEQYIIACLRFSPDDYFRKIVSNHTIDLYTRLLFKFESNSPQINKQVFTFLWKMCNFELEQDYETLAPKSAMMTSSLHLAGTHVDHDSQDSVKHDLNDVLGGIELEKTSKPTLGNMLFNIQTLMAFSAVLNSPVTMPNQIPASVQNSHDKLNEVAKAESISLLQRLGKCVVRRLEELTRKNHLVFVEILFSHPRPQEFCMLMDSVYEAPLYARSATSGASGKPGTDKSAMEKERGEIISSDSSDEDDNKPQKDYGDEFDESDALFAAKSKKVSLKKSSEKKRRSRESDSDNDKESSKKSKPLRRNEWSKEEDAFLREQYAIYAGSKSVFTMIADALRERDIGRHRSAASIAKRVQELRLYMSIQRDSDDEDNEDEGIGSKQQLNESASTDGEPDDSKLTKLDPDSSVSSSAIPPSGNFASGKISKLLDSDWEVPTQSSFADESPESSAPKSSKVPRRKLAKKHLSSNASASMGTAENSDNEDDLFGTVDPAESAKAAKPSALAVMSMRQFGVSGYQIDSDEDDDLFR